MHEKHKVMGREVRNLGLAQERCVDGICRTLLFREAAGRSRGCIWALEQSCWQGKVKGFQGQNTGRRGWLERRAELGGRGAGFGCSPAGTGRAHETEQS